MSLENEVAAALHTEADDLIGAINEIHDSAAAKTAYDNVTIPASGWVSGKFEITNAAITANSTIIPYIPPQDKDAVKALGKAGIVRDGKVVGKVKLSCTGAVPTTAVKVGLLIFNLNEPSA